MGTITKLDFADTISTRYIRVTNEDHRGFIEFQFSIGDPSLYLEMTLPPDAFEEFCREHAVRRLTEAEGAAVDASERRWRFGDDAEENT